MKVAVIGSGAIGGLVAGYLKNNNIDVSLTGHAKAVLAIKEKGLDISGVRGNLKSKNIDISEKLKIKPDLVIFATKTQDLKEALQANLEFIKDSLILTTQNGIQADSLVGDFIPKNNIISSIVMFGSTSLEPGNIVHNFEGSWIMGKAFTPNNEDLTKINVLLKDIFPIIITDKIKGMKYLKVFVNANNCIPAILGLSMQEAFSDIDISSISIAIWKEGLRIIKSADINLVSLPDFPVERVTKLASLPTKEAAKIYSGIMQGLSKEPLYGSILQSIKRGKSSEIDYINGEFIYLAKINKASAPLNEKLVEMVHVVERTKKFFTKRELIESLKEIVY